MQTVPDIIRQCGGAAKIAAASKGAIKAAAVYKWPAIGIPDRHWPLLVRLSGESISAQELYDANIAARRVVRPRKPATPKPMRVASKTVAA